MGLPALDARRLRLRQWPEPFLEPLNVSLDAPAAALFHAPREEVPGIFPVVFGELSLQIRDLLRGQAIEQIGDLPRAGAHRLQHLRLDRGLRFAVETLTRYAIVLAALVAAAQRLSWMTE